MPDDSTLSRRQVELGVALCACKKKREKDEPHHIVLDFTGLKVCGEGEWKQRQHGSSKRRSWRKVHLGVDPKTGETTATTLTENREHDSAQAGPLLEESEQNRGSIGRVDGDGAYDKWICYAAIEARGAMPVIPPQKNAEIQQHGNCTAPALPRDEAIRYIRRHGPGKWKREHAYHVRSPAEAALWRFKGCIGRMLHARTLKNQQRESRLGSQILNRMAAVGMPQSVPVAAKLLCSIGDLRRSQLHATKPNETVKDGPRS